MVDENLKEIRLVGGTALALIIGHRISIDIDLFTDKPFDAEKLGSILSAKYKLDSWIPDAGDIFSNPIFFRN